MKDRENKLIRFGCGVSWGIFCIGAAFALTVRLFQEVVLR